MTVTAVKGRILGVDPGSVRIGIAVSDSRRTMAFPRDVVLAGKTAVEEIVGIAVAEEVTTVVVGRPLSLSGATGASAEIADVFTHELRTALLPHDISVQTLDERFTTSTAAQHLRASGTSSKAARQRIDSAAATVLLETYLEHLRGVD